MGEVMAIIPAYLPSVNDPSAVFTLSTALIVQTARTTAIIAILSGPAAGPTG